MRFLKRLFGFLALLAVLLVVVAYLLPRQVAVSRSVQISAAPEVVFPHVNSLQKFNEWSPWTGIDPAMTVTYSGPDAGVGNTMVWASEHPNVGNGTQVITASTKNERVATSLDFGPMGSADAVFVLTPTDGGTEVTWHFESDMGMNPFGRWMGLMMDRWIGTEYQRGLAQLKEIAEAG